MFRWFNSRLNNSPVCRLAATLALVVALGSSGCNRGPVIPKTEQVSGKVTLKGKPIADAEVYFVHEKLVAYAKTDSQGHYDLVQGAVAGENKVYFSKIEGGSTNPGFKPSDGMDELQMQMAAESGTGPGSGKKVKPPKQVIPAEYSDAANPKLNFLVPSGGTTSADFKL